MPEGPKLILDDDWRKRDETPATSKPAQPAAAPQSGGLEVDTDWKRQAQAERDRLAAAESAKPKSAPGASGQRGRRELPPADFQGLMESFVAQALLYMGAIPDPTTGRAMVSLEHAKYQIDLLGVLEAKTKGQLAPEEAEMLGETLTALRMQYVEITKAVAAMVAEERAKRAAGGAPGRPTGGFGGPSFGEGGLGGVEGLTGPGLGGR